MREQNIGAPKTIEEVFEAASTTTKRDYGDEWEPVIANMREQRRHETVFERRARRKGEEEVVKRIAQHRLNSTKPKDQSFFGRIRALFR